MYSKGFREELKQTLESIESEGLYKDELVIVGSQSAQVRLADGRTVLNFCANNYLGLADHPDIMAAAKKGMDEHGFGMASVRFICGTLDLHKELEAELSTFLGMEDTILYAACFDANSGVFEALLGTDDAIISDQLNHASLIDGIRLCKAARYRYQHNDMADLEKQLKEAVAKGARQKVIVTDGVFSMDGVVADLKGITDLAEQYDALVLVDDCHATGFMGESGRGTHEHHNVMGKVDILTGTLGKALGGGSGGYVSGPKEMIDLLRQRSRPYLFSNTLAPAVAAGSLKVLRMLERSTYLRERLMENTLYYREGLKKLGLTVRGTEHPIVPVMVGDAALSQKISKRMLEKGIFMVGFFYPVVPKGEARLRTQISAAHSRNDLDQVLDAWKEIAEEFNLVD
ncbi:glycine C-acetyltransferase [Puniceicoccales bacterium CK1056]|uniref:2-amino-3-ketobutyrate coenzyme A ligase n=1 Tax=Oceanipulchritudo coccoides TaxID=2706888 RepID=A0A6B2M1C3_9BACT|nr:glycine C-acetyltransferase [Oceanipulchritudo coccoides]NDV61867.1 glycine C-acetyltransferase [Oceanipulchritudo coccoides]